MHFFFGPSHSHVRIDIIIVFLNYLIYIITYFFFYSQCVIIVSHVNSYTLSDCPLFFFCLNWYTHICVFGQISFVLVVSLYMYVYIIRNMNALSLHYSKMEAKLALIVLTFLYKRCSFVLYVISSVVFILVLFYIFFST